MSDAGLKPITVASTRASYVRLSRAPAAARRAPDVAVSASRFVETVADLCADDEPTVVIPGTEPDLFALVHWRHLLPPWVIGLPSEDVLDAVTDRLRLNEAASAAGFAVPETTRVGPGDAIGEGLRFPAVLKPHRTVTVHADTVTSSSAVCVEDRAELEAALRSRPQDAFLVQPRLDGDLYGLAGVMSGSRLLAPVQQVALSLFPAPCGGSAVARSVPVDATIVERLEQLLVRVGWQGIVQLQWIDGPDGPSVIDLNPRIYGSLALANAAGSPLAAIWARGLFGLNGTPQPSREVLYRNLETFTRGQKTNAGRQAHPRAARTASSVFAASDPFPVVASVIRGASKARREVSARLRRAG